MQLRVLTDQLIFIEERTRGHSGILGDAAVVAFAAAALASEHGLGAGIVLLELQVLVDSKGVGHGLYVKVVGTDEREGPTLLLQSASSASQSSCGSSSASIPRCCSPRRR